MRIPVSPSMGVRSIRYFHASSRVINGSMSYVTLSLAGEDEHQIEIDLFVEGPCPSLLAGMIAKAINEAQVAFEATMAKQGG